ncbi:MAG: hydrogenase iron-sulfur subunit [Deltaproteobacteria bacterium]|nr:hydrogenase iron-sulfur subunit [Deltaproteobacteria bacterium]
MSAGAEFVPKIVGIICNWCCYGGADLCGVSRFQYPPFIRLIRVMCSGRIDPGHAFRAFSKGMDGVFIGGCHLNDCHYVTNGNYDALGMVKTCKKVMERAGLNPERLRLEWVSAGEGIRFANIMNEYGARMQKLGPLGKAEGLCAKDLRYRLQAATAIVPYMRLVLSEKLKAPVHLRSSGDPDQAHEKFYDSGEFNRLFDETIGEKLATSRIVLLLRERPQSAGEISERLGLSAAEVSKHLKTSSRQGLVRYDTGLRRYLPADAPS